MQGKDIAGVIPNQGEEISTPYYKGLQPLLASETDFTIVQTSHTDVVQPIAAVKGLESGKVQHLGGHLDGGAANPADFVAFVKWCGGQRSHAAADEQTSPCHLRMAGAAFLTPVRGNPSGPDRLIKTLNRAILSHGH